MGPLVRIEMPEGLEEALESLTRAILKAEPQDIYRFAAEHFQQLLRNREAQSSGLSASTSEEAAAAGVGQSLKAPPQNTDPPSTGEQPLEPGDTASNANSTDPAKSKGEEPQSCDTSYGVEATAVRTLAASTGTVAILGTTAKVLEAAEAAAAAAAANSRQETIIEKHFKDNPSISVTEPELEETQPDEDSKSEDTAQQPPPTPSIVSSSTPDQSQINKIEDNKESPEIIKQQDIPLPEDVNQLPKIVDFKEKQSSIPTEESPEVDVVPVEFEKMPESIAAAEKKDSEDSLDNALKEEKESAQYGKIKKAETKMADPGEGEDASSDVSKTEEENDISSEKLKTNSLSDISISETMNSEGEEAAREAAKAQELKEMVESLSATAEDAQKEYQEVRRASMCQETVVGTSSRSGEHETILEERSPDTPSEPPSNGSNASSKITEVSKVSDKDVMTIVEEEASGKTPEEQLNENNMVCNVEDKVISAATTIQSTFRAYKTRKDLKDTENANIPPVPNSEDNKLNDYLPSASSENTNFSNLNEVDAQNSKLPELNQLPELKVNEASGIVNEVLEDKLNHVKEIINGATVPMNDSKETVNDVKEIVNGAMETLNDAVETVNDTKETVNEVKEIVNEVNSIAHEEHKNENEEPHKELNERINMNEIEGNEKEDEMEKPEEREERTVPEPIVELARAEVDRICSEAERQTEAALGLEDLEEFPSPPEELLNPPVNSGTEADSSPPTTLPLNGASDSSRTEDTTAPSLAESSSQHTPNLQPQGNDGESSLTENLRTEVALNRDSTEGELTMEEDLSSEPLHTAKANSSPEGETDEISERSSGEDPNKEKAATVIQAGYRGFKTRKNLRKTRSSKESSSEQSSEEMKTGEADVNLSNGMPKIPDQIDVLPPSLIQESQREEEARGSSGNALTESKDESSSSTLSEEELNDKAKTIQAGVRGYLVRKDQRVKRDAAVKIQSTFRGFKTRQRLKKNESN